MNEKIKYHRRRLLSADRVMHSLSMGLFSVMLLNHIENPLKFQSFRFVISLNPKSDPFIANFNFIVWLVHWNVSNEFLSNFGHFDYSEMINSVAEIWQLVALNKSDRSIEFGFVETKHSPDYNLYQSSWPSRSQSTSTFSDEAFRIHTRAFEIAKFGFSNRWLSWMQWGRARAHRPARDEF